MNHAPAAAYVAATLGLAGWVAAAMPNGAGPAMVAPQAAAEFVGSDTCADCHREKYDAWRESTHGRAGGPPGPETLIAAFDGTPMRFSDAVVIPAEREGEYTFTIIRQARDTLVFVVDGVVGAGHMVGGGTQGFFSRFDDGTVRFLPFDFSRHLDAWFCNTAPQTGWWTAPSGLSRLRADQGWLPVSEDLSLVECGDWPPLRVLGTSARHANCQQCHGSQITVDFDSAAGRFDTRFTTLAVNCESCHGPGGEHVQRARSGALAEAAEAGIRSLVGLDKDASLDVCFQCHAVKRELRPGHVSGESLGDHYSLRMPLIGGNPFLPDGRVNSFAYQQNHLYSACYLAGSMTCVDCHDPHGQTYRDVFRRPLPDRFDDGQCLGCHPAKAADITGHTNHAPGSEGSRCVACHMPYLQQPAVGDAVPYGRSDHTIPIPRPAFDDSLGIRNACAFCHEDRSAAALQRQAQAWWGEIKPHVPIVAGLIADRARPDPALAADRLLFPGTDHVMAQAASLDRLIRYYLSPGMAALPPGVEDGLRALADHPDPDIRGMALAALHLTRGGDPDMNDFLNRRMIALRDDTADVRQRWAAALSFIGEDYRAAGRLEETVIAYQAALQVRPDEPALLLDLASAYDLAGESLRALDYYLRTLEVDPTQSVAWINAGITLETLGREPEAEAAYRRAIEVNPHEALGYMNLGNVDLRRGEMGQAIEHYRQAVAQEPGLARAHYYLGLAYLSAGHPVDAVQSLMDAREFAPDDPEIERLLERARAVVPPR